MDVLLLWEKGLQQHPVDRALTIIMIAYPDFPYEQLVNLSKGQRDERLLTIREQLFGRRINGVVLCKFCDEQLAVSFDMHEIRPANGFSEISSEYTLESGAYHISFRPVNSLDLAAIASCRSPDEARKQLIKRCVIKAKRNKKPTTVSRLPKGVVAALSKKLSDIDPHAEMKISLTCEMCKHKWQVEFDILSFLWNEISDMAKSLFYDIHKLAYFYGWHERDILSLSPIRRQMYLEMIS